MGRPRDGSNTLEEEYELTAALFKRYNEDRQLFESLASGPPLIRPQDKIQTPFPFRNKNRTKGARENLRSSPASGKLKWHPTPIRLEWGVLWELKQNSFVNSIKHLIIGAAPIENRTRFRHLRYSCDSHRVVELQFEEPQTLAQIKSLGQTMSLFAKEDPKLLKLPYAPYSIHLNCKAGENSINRKYIPPRHQHQHQKSSGTPQIFQSHG